MVAQFEIISIGQKYKKMPPINVRLFFVFTADPLNAQQIRGSQNSFFLSRIAANTIMPVNAT